MTSETIAAARLRALNEKIDQACETAKRAPGAARLVAISKTFEADQVRPYLQAGQRVFGENRVQEAKSKWPQLRAEFPDVELHLVGPLQTNKVREALDLFDCIQTLDREKLAAELAKEIVRLAPGRQRMAPKLFVQVNTGEEEQKAGVSPRDCVAFVKLCVETYKLQIDGLMCIPPVTDPPGPHFALLNKLAKEADVTELSMGMSADFEEAVWLGATCVRVGSALFGNRN